MSIVASIISVLRVFMLRVFSDWDLFVNIDADRTSLVTYVHTHVLVCISNLHFKTQACL